MITLKKKILIIEQTKEKCTLKTDGKTDAADVCDMLLAALCLAGKHLVKNGSVTAKIFKDVAIHTLEKEFKEPESEGKQDEAGDPHAPADVGVSDFIYGFRSGFCGL